MVYITANSSFLLLQSFNGGFVWQLFTSGEREENPHFTLSVQGSEEEHEYGSKRLFGGWNSLGIHEILYINLGTSTAENQWGKCYS